MVKPWNVWMSKVELFYRLRYRTSHPSYRSQNPCYRSESISDERPNQTEVLGEAYLLRVGEVHKKEARQKPADIVDSRSLIERRYTHWLSKAVESEYLACNKTYQRRHGRKRDDGG
jgi:hypothetical protein